MMGWPQFVTIYAIEHIASGKAYVGSTKKILSKRAAEHVYLLNHPIQRHHSPLLQNMWNKYGAGAFRFLELDTSLCKTSKERTDLEARWVLKIGSLNCNPVDESNGAFTFSEERRKSMGSRVKKEWETDTELSNARLKGFKEGWEDPDFGAKQAALLKKIHRDNPDIAKRQGASLKKTWSDPEKNEGLKQRNASRWYDPNSRAKQSEVHSKLWSDPTWKARRVAQNKVARLNKQITCVANCKAMLLSLQQTIVENSGTQRTDTLC